MSANSQQQKNKQIYIETKYNISYALNWMDLWVMPTAKNAFRTIQWSDEVEWTVRPHELQLIIDG